jgi:sodium-dependent dicarboxylate transporter 2/3/5
MFGSVIKRREFWGLFLGLALFLALLLAPPFSGLTRASQNAAALALLMACFWIGEVVPIYATALFPLVFLPLLGVLDTKAVAAQYADRIVFLMMGGFMIAEAMKKWELHKRIALHTIRLIGRSASGMILGFMAATALLSMWMSNSATAVMMIPIAVSVIWQVQGVSRAEDIEPDPFSTSLMLGIAYSASVGGIATLIGTPPNAIFAGQVKVLFPGATEVFFDQWIRLGLPVSIIMLIIVWLVLTRLMFRAHKKGLVIDRGLIRDEINKLGPMSRGEKTVLVVFMVTAGLWMSRRLWSGLIPEGVYVHDSTIAIAAAAALFLIPVDLDKWEFALDRDAARQIPWGVLILFGGGFALAAGLARSGFAEWAGSHLSLLHGIHPLLIIVLVCLLMTFLTEVTMNTSTTTIMMPVMAFTAAALEVHPFMLMIPATLSASCAFMLPAATPPNAIVFGSGLVRLPQMAKTGIVLNLIGILVVSLCVYFLAGWAFGIDLHSMPAWAVTEASR